MIVVVLFTLLLMAGILAATLRLSLGGRQNTADQAATLQAQYAAESGVSLAQSRLRDIQAMLTYASSRVSGGTGLQLARNIKVSAVQGWMNSLCGTANWASISEGKAQGDPGYFDPGPNLTSDRDDALYPAAQACVPAGYTSPSQFILLSKVVTNAAYGVLPAAEQPTLTDEAKQTFWYNLFTQNSIQASDQASTSTGLKIVRILKLTYSHYRVFLKASSLTSNSLPDLGAQRTVNGQSTQKGTWWFDINQPALLEAVVQTDYQTSFSGSRINFTTTTAFEGPLKTNDVFAFVSSAGNNSPSFSGQLRSAGCTDRIVTTEQVTCTRNPGVKIDSDTATRNFAGPTDAQKSQKIRNYIASKGVSVNYNGLTPDYASDYQPFPQASLIQENAAAGKDEDGNPLPGGQKGLTLSASQIGVQLFAGDANGNALATYDSTNNKWNEPSSVYQYIKPITAQSCTSSISPTGCTYTYDTTIYRVDKNKNLEKKVGSGGWTTVSGVSFNGVLYKSGGLTVVGPQPGRNDYANTASEVEAKPALASFAAITVAATGDVTVRSDLALSQTPCRYSEYSSAQVNPSCKDRENVLGLFSSAGNVIVSKQVPDNAVLQAALMSSEKEFTVDGHDAGDPRGEMKFTGSLVEKYYGANGTFGTEQQCTSRDRYGRCIYQTVAVRTGYTRDYSYDKRFSDGLTPPFYPTSPKWTFTDASSRMGDLSDIVWSQGKK